MAPTETPPIIQNVVATVDLDLGNETSELDLRSLANRCANTQYNPRRFPAVVIRKKQPKTTGLIFAKGKMIVIGAKSVGMAEEAARKLAKDIQKSLFPNGAKLSQTKFQVRNMVASAAMGYKVNLQRIQDDDNFRKDSTLEENFPGLIYRLKNPKLVALVFSSGKIVFTGATKESDIQNAFDKLKLRLLKFRKLDKEKPDVAN